METLTKTKWAIDATHTQIEFKVKHLMLTTVTGSFQKYAAEIEADDDTFNRASINFLADVNSISTGNEQRDGHLKSPDFFDAAAFPEIKFTATKFESGKLTGNLTIKDVTKLVTLDVELNGIAKDPWGQTKAGFEITGKISRKEFGLKWNALTEAGGAVVSDEVKIHAQVQLVK
jgi:polyisoprenoid-binding protein YceI